MTTRSGNRQTADGTRIVAIDKDSLADIAGIRADDQLIAINGAPIRDEIDLRFHSACEDARVETRHGARKRTTKVRKEFHQELGLEVESFKVRRCHNNCVFCFCHQQPKGLRRSLSERDDDYRMSFLHGNYITGQGLSRADLTRIAQQRLAPLYLSVHALDPDLRGRLLGLRRAAPVTPLLDFMAQRRLAFQTQIVLCPGLNDGAVLERTVDALAAYHPYCESVAIVPVGLTSHREGLTPLRRVTPHIARKIIDSTADQRRRLARRIGRDIVYLSDEIYLTAGRDMPAYGRRDYWLQLENGIGMVYDFYRDFRARRLPKRIRKPKRVALITGTLGATALRRLADAMNQINGLTVDVVALRNRVFGSSVTVSGLLGGDEIVDAISRRQSRYDVFCLPPNCLRREDGPACDRLFIDDITLADAESAAGSATVWSNVMTANAVIEMALRG